MGLIGPRISGFWTLVFDFGGREPVEFRVFGAQCCLGLDVDWFWRPAALEGWGLGFISLRCASKAASSLPGCLFA